MAAAAFSPVALSPATATHVGPAPLMVHPNAPAVLAAALTALYRAPHTSLKAAREDWRPTFEAQNVVSLDEQIQICNEGCQDFASG